MYLKQNYVYKKFEKLKMSEFYVTYVIQNNLALGEKFRINQDCEPFQLRSTEFTIQRSIIT